MEKKDILTWDEYFMGIAHLSGQRSKDPNTKVGACIVSSDNKIVGIGYNGLPRGLNDEDYPWQKREGDFLDTKYPYIVHAELNAILNTDKDLKNHRLYVSLFPCNECAKAIIQSGIKEVIYESDKYEDSPATKASKKMFDDAQVKYRQLPYQLDVNVIKKTEN